ncbi:hypothetical protein F4553_007638 [Allocatelliglobosispora scoriae]|uniref:WXG100 family type VII secretion target n=1 Tax=Allocatelliglobosispora scoriae TaxID=643052 RepID=A0A841C1G8_9ACTN|nr:hypothetical protein [Allocatelliglobosispora scoriae]MBB5874204.1 hypothetical protein [Allocatelliglobosispora scoriae]
MSALIIIDADALNRVAAELKVPAETVRRAIEAFNDTIAGIGKPWGDDKLGKEWAKVYNPGVLSVQEGFDQIVDSLIGLSEDFKTMAKAYLHAEQSNTR